MARIRTLKPEFWGDQRLSPLSPITRLVFIGLISNADDFGRLADNSKTLDGLLFPETDDSCKDALETLATIGVITRGKTSSGQRVIQIVGWEKHQKVSHRNDKSSLPPLEIGAPAALQSDSGGIPASTSDLRPTTMDRRPPTMVEADDAEDPSKPSPEEFRDAWNDAVEHSQLDGLPKPWCDMLADRRKDEFWRRGWRKALALIHETPFLCGGGPKGWKCHAEWFLKPTSVTRILGGEFNDFKDRTRFSSAGGNSRPLSGAEADPAKYRGVKLFGVPKESSADDKA